MATAPKFTPDPKIARLMARSDAMLGMALQPRKNPLPQNPYYIPGMAGMVGQLGSGLMSRRARTRGEDIENRQKMAQQMLGAALDPYADFMPPTPVSQPEQVSPIRGLLRKAMPQQKTDAEIYEGLKGLGTGEVGVVAGTNPFDILSYKKSLVGSPHIVYDPNTRTATAWDKSTGEMVWTKHIDEDRPITPDMYPDWFAKDTNLESTYRLDSKITSSIPKTVGIFRRFARVADAFRSGIQLPVSITFGLGEKYLEAATRIGLIQNEILPAFVANKKYPVKEMAIVRKLIPKGDKIFANPESMIRQYQNLLEGMVNQRFNLYNELVQGETSSDRRKEITIAVAELTNAIDALTGNYTTEQLIERGFGPSDQVISRTATETFEAMSDADLRNAAQQAREDESNISNSELDALIIELEKRGIK